MTIPLATLLILTAMVTFFSQGKSKRTALIIVAQIFATLIILLSLFSLALWVHLDLHYREDTTALDRALIIVGKLKNKLAPVLLVSTTFWLFPPPSRLIAHQKAHWHRTMHYVLAITMVHAVLQILTSALRYASYFNNMRPISFRALFAVVHSSSSPCACFSTALT